MIEQNEIENSNELLLRENKIKDEKKEMKNANNDVVLEKPLENFENLKVGLNQCFGENLLPNPEKYNRYNTESLEYKTINLELKSSEKLINFVEKYCKISNISKEEFITILIITRLSYIYSSPGMTINYIKSKDDFFEDLKEGVNNFYKNTISKRKP